IFTPLDLKRRIFTKVTKINQREQLPGMVNGVTEDITNQLSNHDRLRENAFDSALISQIAVDQNGILVLANAQARTLFGIGLKDLGRPFRDLEASYRPAELRSRIEQAYAERGLVVVRDV